MESAAKYFQQNLSASLGAAARGYLSDRGVLPSTQTEFRIGYAPAGRFGLKEHLGAKGISVSDMIDAGLLVSGEDIAVPYDRFRDRIMIPIQDQQGRIVGFGGRALKSEVKPKYLNSPETTIFHKGSVVFNFHRARQPAHDSGSVVAVEGYMDAIAVYQAGIKGVVATMGTAFTEEQIASLWRLSSEPIVCFDSDRAGVAAAYRSLDRILPVLVVGKTFRFAFISDGEDPDDLIRERGVEAFKGVLDGSRPVWDMLWEREVGAADLRSPDKQAELERRLYSLIRTIKDQAVHTAYFRTCRMQLAQYFWEVNRTKRSDKRTENKFVREHVHIEPDGARHGLQKILLGMLVHYPEFLDEKFDQVESLQFSPRLNEFRIDLYRLLVREQHLSVQAIYTNLKPDFFDVLQDIHGEPGDGHPWGYRLFQRFPLLKSDPPHHFVSRCIDHFVNELHLQQMDEDIGWRQKEAGDENASDEAMNLLIDLKRARHEHEQRMHLEAAELMEEAEGITRIYNPGRGSLPRPLGHPTA